MYFRIDNQLRQRSEVTVRYDNTMQVCTNTLITRQYDHTMYRHSDELTEWVTPFSQKIWVPRFYVTQIWDLNGEFRQEGGGRSKFF